MRKDVDVRSPVVHCGKRRRPAQHGTIEPTADGVDLAPRSTFEVHALRGHLFHDSKDKKQKNKNKKPKNQKTKKQKTKKPKNRVAPQNVVHTTFACCHVI